MSALPASRPVRRVAIAGGGLAAWMCAAHLAHHLPHDVSITVAGPDGPARWDALYGFVLPPEVFAFHTGIGLDERDLIADTDTAFALGTEVSGWAGRSWVQPFHLPLPVVGGVPAHLAVAQDPDASLQPLLVSALAGQAGRFAHPPEDASHPLSRAEYGYQVSPDTLAGTYRACAGRVVHAASGIADVERTGDTVTALRLDTGERVEADIFIDATGPDACLAGQPAPERTVRVAYDERAHSGASLPTVARVTASDTGWTLSAATRVTSHRLAVGADDGDSVPIFRQAKAWSGNVVALGQAACTVEPLTLAPMRLLLRDVQRLASLFPVTTDMRIERDAFNAKAMDDQDHALIFHYAHFRADGLPAGPVFADAAAWSHPKLSRKWSQYAERGYLVSYDREPFFPLDWAVLMDGLGISPRRTDTLTAQADSGQAGAQLSALAHAARGVVRAMPPHALYLSKFLDYIARTHHTDTRHAG